MSCARFFSESPLTTTTGISAGFGHAPQAAQHFEAADPRQQQVQQDDVGKLFARPLQRLFPIFCAYDFIAGPLQGPLVLQPEAATVFY
jgi:hypothetical protein